MNRRNVRRHVAPDRQPILDIRSPDQRVRLEILPPGSDSPAYYASVEVEGDIASMGFPFGYDAPPGSLSVRWDLPDDTMAILLEDRYYVLFRFGARRRRRREYFRLGRENAFSQDEIAWITAKSHSVGRRA